MRTLLALIMLAIAPLASAQLVIDQQNEMEPAYPLVLGGASEQALAQLVRVEQSGPLAKVRLHIGCDPVSHGRIRLDIQSAGLLRPDGELHVLDSVERDVTSFGPSVQPEGFPLSGVWFDAGTHFAVVVRASSGVSCSVLAGPPPSYYPWSFAWYDARPNPPGWIVLGHSLQLATFVRLDEPSCRFLGATGGNDAFVPPSAPVCRCLQDSTLLAQRCRFELPEFVLVREVPPVRKDSLVARWLVIPLQSAAPALRVESHGVDTWLGGDVLETEAGAKPMQPLQLQTRHWTKSGGPRLTRFDVDVGGVSYRFEARSTLP